MRKAGCNAKARADGPHRATKGGDAIGDRPKGEGLGLRGARGVWLRERKAALSAAVPWRVIGGSASGITWGEVCFSKNARMGVGDLAQW